MYTCGCVLLCILVVNAWFVNEVISHGLPNFESIHELPKEWENNHFPDAWLRGHHDMYSTDVISEFSYNKKFALLWKWDATEGIYDIVSGLFKNIAEKDPSTKLKKKERNVLKRIRKAAVKEFKRDNGVVVFDQGIGNWTFCAWIDLGYVFYDEFRGLRLCTPFHLLNIGAILRAPDEGTDYVAHSSLAFMLQQFMPFQRAGSAAQVVKSARNGNMMSAFASVNVELLQSQEFVDRCKYDYSSRHQLPLRTRFATPPQPSTNPQFDLPMHAQASAKSRAEETAHRCAATRGTRALHSVDSIHTASA